MGQETSHRGRRRARNGNPVEPEASPQNERLATPAAPMHGVRGLAAPPRDWRTQASAERVPEDDARVPAQCDICASPTIRQPGTAARRLPATPLDVKTQHGMPRVCSSCDPPTVIGGRSGDLPLASVPPVGEWRYWGRSRELGKRRITPSHIDPCDESFADYPVLVSSTGSVFVPIAWDPYPATRDLERRVRIVDRPFDMGAGGPVKGLAASSALLGAAVPYSVDGVGADSLMAEPDVAYGSFINPLLPWQSAVGKVQTTRIKSDGKKETCTSCTGSLIGSRRVVISAAHCFFSDGHWKCDVDDNGSGIFMPGWDALDADPFGAYFVQWFWVPGQWLDYEYYSRDWALLALFTTPPSSLLPYGGQSVSSTTLLTAKLHMIGYPEAKQNGDHQWKDNCSAISVFALSIRHDCQSWDGSSGAGTYRWNHDWPHILAINKGNPWDPDEVDYNVGVRLTGDRIDTINDFIDDWG